MLRISLSLVIGFLLLALACKPTSRKSPAPSQGATGAFPATEQANSADGMLIDIPTMIYLDAEVHTFGILSLTVKNAKSPLQYQRFLAVDKPMAISASERQDLKRICRDISIAPDAMNPTPALEVKADQTYYIQWRSHYSAELKKSLGSALAAGRNVRCVLQLKDPASGQRSQIQLNPVADQNTVVKGVVNREAALKAGILLVEDSKGLIEDSNLLLVEEAASIVLGVKALNRNLLAIKEDPETGDACYYAQNGVDTRVGNPQLQKKIDASVQGLADFAIRRVQPASLGGRLLKSCADVRVTYKNKDLQSSLSCETYQKIKEEGLEAGCQWEVSVENPLDPENSEIVNMQLSRLKFAALDLNKLSDVQALIPKSVDNPVRGKKIQVGNFSDVQSAMLTDAFDLWLAVDVESYEDDFLDAVKTVNYRTDAEGCIQTAGFVDEVGGSVINLCDLGGYSSEYQEKRLSNPFGVLLRAQVLAHESRHIKGFKHDWIAEDYSPCEGTGASAVLPYKVAAECKKDFCPILRDAAYILFLHELNYSIRDDARRFQGQCKSWSDKMGLTMADIQNGK